MQSITGREIFDQSLFRQTRGPRKLGDSLLRLRKSHSAPIEEPVKRIRGRCRFKEREVPVTYFLFPVPKEPLCAAWISQLEREQFFLDTRQGRRARQLLELLAGMSASARCGFLHRNDSWLCNDTPGQRISLGQYKPILRAVSEKKQVKALARR